MFMFRHRKNFDNVAKFTGIGMTVTHRDRIHKATTDEIKFRGRLLSFNSEYLVFPTPIEKRKD